MTSMKQLILTKRPGTSLEADTTKLVDAELPDVTDHTFSVRISHVTLEVSMIGWMREGRSYLPNISIGDPIRATAVGIVQESRHSGFSPGDMVTGLFNAASHVVSNGEGVVKLDPAVAGASEWAGALGLTTAFTSYVGMSFAPDTLDGKTVLVSGASGLVGGFAAQFARKRGARVIGIAGGADACRAAQEKLGLEECIDYKDARPFVDALHSACPDRIDVFYDNVGGEIFDAGLGWMNAFGTVVMCGQTSERGRAKPPAVTNIRTMIMERLTMRGFVVFDHPAVIERAIQDISKGVSSGELKIPHADILHDGGLSAFHTAYDALVNDPRKGKHVLCL